MQFDQLSDILDARSGQIVTTNCGKYPFRTRRVVLAGLGASFLLGAFGSPVAAAAAKYRLKSSWKKGDAQRVDAEIEVLGQLRMNADGKKVVTAPLKVTGRFAYEERLLSSATSLAARSYERAEAKISIGSGSVQPTLRTSRQQIVVQDNNARLQLRSVGGPLTREELDLISIQGNTSIIEALLPTDAVAIGDSWSPASKLWPKLLGIDAVSQNDIRASLEKIDKNTALVRLTGKLTGAVGGVQTEIELRGSYTFSRTQSRITSIDWTVEEDRAIAHAEPGLKVVAKLKVRINPLATPRLLPDAFLQVIPLEASAQDLALEFMSSGGYQILLDRRWRVMLDRPDATVLRLVDRGDLIAQCNISRLPDQAGSVLSLEKFQAGIQAALGEQPVTFQEASQTTLSGGLRLLRVVAKGTISDLKIQWRYFHLSNEQGASASYVVTVEEDLLARLGNADEVLTNAFSFQKRQAVAARHKKPAKR